MTTTTPIRPVHRLTDLVDGVRAPVAVRADWADTAQLVAGQLRTHLPALDVFTAEQRLGSPDDYCGHTLHVEPDGSFSIVALVWRPGQTTRIHDHVGEVSGFAPPGDIHRVRNASESTAISIHIYGTDITRLGSSARRYYD